MVHICMYVMRNFVVTLGNILKFTEIKNGEKMEELIKKITAFRDERNWTQFHNPKDMAISISLEASELLELFQWSGGDTEVYEKSEQMREELADVLIYCIMMADVLGLDIQEIIEEKLQKNAARYPVKESYGNKQKYTELKQIGRDHARREGSAETRQ